VSQQDPLVRRPWAAVARLPEMEYDPTQFGGTARYYRRGRPPYSAQLGDVLARELGVDGNGGAVDGAFYRRAGHRVRR